jgi:peptidoglycan hydrolase-like protein with peptidoglycan-binding domain
MQALRDRSNRPARRSWTPWLVAGLVVLFAAAGGIAYAATASKQKSAVQCGVGTSCSSSATSGAVTDSATKTISVVSTSPASGSTNVQPNSRVTVKFSSAVAANSPTPTITPNVTGSWAHVGEDLVFTPARSLVPYTKYTVTIPGGASGVVGVGGAHLRSSTTVPFTVAAGSVLRLQQLLAKLGYLPLTFSGTTPAPIDMALPQPGTFSWKWSSLPSALTSQWVAGSANPLTKSAVMMFETQNGLSVDGIAGPIVWTSLLSDAATNKANSEPWTYVLVTKTMSPSEHLTAWVNGTLQFHDVLVNTGVRGATTRNGTFEVFEHVRESHMSGTDVTGTHYTIPTVPWVSYFNGGDALHYYPRASYGFPQSNGCVEMQLATAQALWPDTPIGTLVTVQGPTNGGTSAKNTTPAQVSAGATSPTPTTSTTTSASAAAATTSTTTTAAPAG